MPKLKTAVSLRYRLEYWAIMAVFSVVRILPFRQRSAFIAWVMARVISPLVGYRKRVRDNLDLIWPDLGKARRDALTTEVTRNVGRTLCELFSPEDLVRLSKSTDLTGPGVAAMEEACATKRPVIIVSGHFGNYDIVRAVLIRHGFNIGGLYRRMNNPLFHDFYINNISTIGTPLFERGRSGLGQMIKHLKSGGILGALVDVRANDGVPLPFFGQDAMTATSMAELALRYDALLIPFYGTRLPDGESFTADFEEPIPHSDPVTMTLSINKSLEARIVKNPEQWFWIHNRWKGGAQ